MRKSILIKFIGLTVFLCSAATASAAPPAEYEIKAPVAGLMAKKPKNYLKIKDKIHEIILQMPEDLFDVWEAPERELPEDCDLVLLEDEEYPAFVDDLDYANLDQALSGSLTYLTQFNANFCFEASGLTFTKAEIERSLWKFKDFLEGRPSAEELDEFLRANYHVFQSSGRTDQRDVLFTGYFEPVYKGAPEPDEQFKYPVWGRPEDMARNNGRTGRFDTEGNFVPYHTREEIDVLNALEGKAPVLAWLESPLDRFFLQIQGSGRVELTNGNMLRLNYETQNGHHYVALGAILIDEGHIAREEMSMQAIYDFFHENPDLCEPMMLQNPSYVFFKVEDQGPFGSLCVPVTAMRSLALDRKVYPPGALMLVQACKPELDKDGKIKEWLPISRFMLHQDAGGAIKGSGRADIFWGSGDYAATAAGNMQHLGKLYLFMPKN